MFPTDEDEIHTGIEKGYEHFLLPSPEESSSDTESSPLTSVFESEPSETVLLPETQLQTFFPHFTNFLEEGTSRNTGTSKLRQFRKNLKRSKVMPAQQVTLLINNNLLFFFIYKK